MTYRFKTVIFVLLLSFLLNIFHDSILSSEVNPCWSTNVQLLIEEPSSTACNIAIELHKHFHFIALFELIEPTIKSLTTSTNPSYLVSISPQFILESSFKPPRI